MYAEAVIYGVDGREDRRDEAKELFQITCFTSIEETADRGIEAAFVCTSPLYHNKIIKECLNNGWNVFTELNLVSDGYEENIALAEKNIVHYFYLLRSYIVRKYNISDKR